MKYEEIALNEALELSDTELETIAGGQHHGWSEGQGCNNDDRHHCHHRRNRGQGYSGISYNGQDCSGQGYSGIGYIGQDCSGQGYSGQGYDGDDCQHRCRR
ncbi:MAG TPA: hypothetical protein VII61_12100 [Ktedonobacteraceae bacterium]